MKRKREEAAIELRRHWQQRGITIPERWSIQDVRGQKIVEPTAKEAE